MSYRTETYVKLLGQLLPTGACHKTTWQRCQLRFPEISWIRAQTFWIMRAVFNWNPITSDDAFLNFEDTNSMLICLSFTSHSKKKKLLHVLFHLITKPFLSLSVESLQYASPLSVCMFCCIAALLSRYLEITFKQNKSKPHTTRLCEVCRYFSPKIH